MSPLIHFQLLSPSHQAWLKVGTLFLSQELVSGLTWVISEGSFLFPQGSG